jgi:hypothetical protein
LLKYLFRIFIPNCERVNAMATAKHVTNRFISVHGKSPVCELLPLDCRVIGKIFRANVIVIYPSPTDSICEHTGAEGSCVLFICTSVGEHVHIVHCLQPTIQPQVVS